jgi:DNA-binding response OmpR family regulator/anti-sigma regulatory factor (Ser/Thr protein kinase)
MDKKILIVDDDKYIRRLLTQVLGKFSYKTFEAVSGDEALPQAYKVLPDVILLDLMMPGLDGYSVCERLKENESTRDIPVIFVTAKTDLQDRIHGLGVGAHDYICKPIQPKELIARVDAALRVKELQDNLKDKLRLQEELERARQQLTEQYMSSIFGQLAESLLHELNNPLAAVVGFAELIKRRNIIADEQTITLIESIRDMGLRASSKLSSLLCVAKTDGSKSYVSINNIVSDVLALINARLLSSRVEADISLQERLPEIKGSSNQLSRAVLALLNNAVDVAEEHSESGRRKISISTQLMPSHEIKITVCDFGGNLTKEVTQRLCEPFFTTKGNQHTGLGLFMAKSVVSAHQGRLRWESNPEATCFYIVLPVEGRE